MKWKIVFLQLFVAGLVASNDISNKEVKEIQVKKDELQKEDTAPEKVKAIQMKTDDLLKDEFNDIEEVASDIEDELAYPRFRFLDAEPWEYGRRHDHRGHRWNWKLQQSHVCFQTYGHKYATFTVKAGGQLEAIKLVRTSGSVRCAKGVPTSYWGCGGYRGFDMGTIITDRQNTILFPRQEIKKGGWYTLPNYNSNSKTIIMTAAVGAPIVKKGQTLRIWYGEDLYDYYTTDNSGQTCADIYAYFKETAVKYTIHVRTTDKGSAGTDAHVQIILYGNHDNTGSLPLTTSSLHADPFEQDNVDIFTVEGKDVGPVTKIRISHDNSGSSPGWHLKNVIVSREGEQCKMVFYYHEWLEDDKLAVDLYPDLSSSSCAEDPITYHIDVKTGNKWTAGTDAIVYINMEGDKGVTGKRILRTSSTYSDPFERNHLDIFIGKVTNVGRISAITIGHDGRGGGPGWYLEKVIVKTATCTWIFAANQWLEKDHRTVKLHRTGGKC